MTMTTTNPALDLLRSFFQETARAAGATHYALKTFGAPLLVNGLPDFTDLDKAKQCIRALRLLQQENAKKPAVYTITQEALERALEELEKADRMVSRQPSDEDHAADLRQDAGHHICNARRLLKGWDLV